MERKVDEALEHFALVLRRPVHEPLVLGPCRINNEDWEQLLLSSDTLGSLQNIYIVDSMKTYFEARQFNKAIEFVARVREAKLFSSNSLLLEGEIISYARLGDYEMAYSLSKLRDDNEILDTLVFMLYEASCLVALNRCDQADCLARDLTSFVLLGGLDQFAAPVAMRYLAGLGVLLEGLARQIDAIRIYDLAYNLAVGAGDQPFQILFLSATILQPENEQRQELEETRTALLSDCYYDNVLRSEGLPGGRWSQTFDDLLTTVSRATNGALVLESPGSVRPAQ